MFQKPASSPVRIVALLYTLVACLETVVLAAPPSSFDDFDVVGLVGDPETSAILTLDQTTINKINCGCADGCGPGVCTDPSDTYLYFPIWLNAQGNPKWYRFAAGEIQINRSTDLYLVGADTWYTRFAIRDQDLTPSGPAAPIFTVVAAPLIYIAKVHVWPDPGYIEMNDFPDGPVALAFHNSQTTRLELLDSLFTGTKIKFNGPGDFRLQHVTASTQAAVDAFLDVNHEQAEVTIVGGIQSSVGAFHPERLQNKIATNCLTVDQPAPGNPAECACGADGCDGVELDALEALCNGPNAPEGCPWNPCGCTSHFVWQRNGHVQLFSTGLINTLGEADLRFDNAAPVPHAVVNPRSEGPKCSTGYPPTLVQVPQTTEAVDVLVVAATGAWFRDITPCGPYDTKYEQYGAGRLADYNGQGTLWLLHNTAPLGAGALTEGTASGATIVAAGNRFFANESAGGADPTYLFPMNPGTCSVSGEPCFGGDPDSCPGSGTCSAPSIQLVTAGNMWSRGDFCDWCEHQADPSVCDAPCDGGWTLGDLAFTDENEGFTDYSEIPTIPEVIVPPPINLPPVNSPLPRMVSAKAECGDSPCPGYYPSDCYYCVGGICSPGIYPHTDPTCWIQAGLYKGIAEGKPVFIPEGTYTIWRPLYWIHADQVSQQGVPIPTNYPGGWIVGQNNNVTIRNSDPEAVLTTHGMNLALIQGITFETAPYTGAQTHSTLDMENNPSIGRQTANIALHDCNFKGGRHALGLCVDSSIQCDTIMTVNGTFRDAHIGFANGGWNALQNIAYNATLVDNEVGMGHDDVYTAAGQGNWAALHASITSNRTGARDINLFGGNLPYYFHDLSSTNAVVLSETLAQNRAYSILFDHSTLAQGVAPLATPMIDYAQAQGPMFLYSDLSQGWIRLSDAGAAAKGRGAWKIHSEAFGWPDNLLEDEEPDIDPAQTSRLFEFETCREADPCAPCRKGKLCEERGTGDTQCLEESSSTWVISSCGDLLVYEECTCKAQGPGQICPLLGDEGVFDTCP